MALVELTDRKTILETMREYDQIGQDAFLAKYGFAPSRQYRVLHDGRSYDGKAIVGVAFKHQFPDRGPLANSDFSGGEATVVPLLEKLGFEVQRADHKNREKSGEVSVTLEAQSENPVQTGLEEFLDTYPSIRSSVSFGLHDQLKACLNNTLFDRRARNPAKTPSHTNKLEPRTGKLGSRTVDRVNG